MPGGCSQSCRRESSLVTVEEECAGEAGEIQVVLQLSEIESHFQVVLPFYHGKAVGKEKGIGDGNQQLLILAPAQAVGEEPRNVDVGERTIGKAADAQLLAPIASLFFGPQLLILPCMTCRHVIDSCWRNHPVVRQPKRLLRRAFHSVTGSGDRMGQNRHGPCICIQAIVPGTTETMIGTQLMIDLDRVVAIVVPVILSCQVVVKDPRAPGIRNKTEDLPGDSTNTIARNDIADERITRESSCTVGPGRGRIISWMRLPSGFLNADISPFLNAGLAPSPICWKGLNET